MDRPTHLNTQHATTHDCRLVPFHSGYAELLLSWIRDEREALWLAPRSRPPLTVASILEWSSPGRHPYLLVEAGRSEPVGYGEVNLLDSSERKYWLGHLLVDPAQRGRGLGRRLTELLMRHALDRLRARQVMLVVFPENREAIRAYEAAGMKRDGFELHEFPAYQLTVRLLRMVAWAR